MDPNGKRKAEDSLQTSALKKPRTAESDEWEVMDGDNRDTILPGAPQPTRLTMRFRNKTTNVERTLIYKKKEAKDIDWNSKDDIHNINKWRNSVFIQKGFPALVEKLPWAPTEKGYLELFLERVAMAAKEDSSIVVPDKEKILEAFNDYFDGRTDLRDAKGNELPMRQPRTLQPFKSYLNRPGSKVRALRDGLISFKTSNGDDAYMPNITDDDIAAFIDSGIIGASTAKNGDSTTHNNTSKPEGLTQQTNPRAPDTNNAQAPVAPRASKWNCQPDTPVVMTPPDAVARLEAEGWVGPPPIPKSDAEALQRHRELKSEQPLNTTHIVKAEEDLDAKLERYPLPVGSYYQRNGLKRDWVGDQKGGKVKADCNGSKSLVENPRHVEAAGITGILGAAIIPPYGYSGDIRDLDNRRLLSDEEYVLHDSNRFMRNKLHEEHETQYDNQN